jgi:hypothetical protein
MKANEQVKITKLAELPNAKVTSAKWENHVPGGNDNTLSLPVAYVVEGTLEVDIVCGQSVRMLRTKRNGVEMPGYFVTSPVTELGDGSFKTFNSEYKIEPI